LTRLHPLRIWYDPRKRLWRVGADESVTDYTAPSSLGAVAMVKEHCLEYGYTRDITVVCRDGTVVELEIP
jgi:hypothetical protein